jgi:glycosyltransferase involved in cell wall biosynthesis
MACGCVVVGYHGNGGKEFFRTENSINVEDRNIIDFVLKVENTCILFENNIENFHKFSKNSSKIIQDEYTYEIEERSTLEIYNKILK